MCTSSEGKPRRLPIRDDGAAGEQACHTRAEMSPIRLPRRGKEAAAPPYTLSWALGLPLA